MRLQFGRCRSDVLWYDKRSGGTSHEACRLLPFKFVPLFKPQKYVHTLEAQDFELKAEYAADAVVERSEILARDVALHVSRIPVISDVEDFEADPSTILLTKKRNRYVLRYLRVDGDEGWIATGLIARSDKVLISIYSREGKSVAPIDDWRKRYAVRKSDISPEKEAVRGIKSQPAVLVLSNDRLAKIAEE
jgi:hypothetical protein